MVSDGHLGSETTVHRWQAYARPSQEVQHFTKDLLAGGVAGALSKSCVAPLERVKILFQTGTMTNNSISQTLLRISRQEGIQGWYRGNGASVLRVVPYAAFHFATYEQFRKLLAKQVYGVDSTGKQMPPSLDLMAGSLAGGSAVLLTYPLDLVRTRLAYDSESVRVPCKPSKVLVAGNVNPKSKILSQQRPDRKEAVQLSERLNSNSTASSSQASQSTGESLKSQNKHMTRGTIRSVLKQTWQSEGPIGLYRGIGPTLMGILPYAGLKFYMYQSFKQQYTRFQARKDPDPSSAGDKLPILMRLAFGGLSGVVAQTFTYPLDVVRRSMQVQNLRGNNLAGPTSTWLSLKQVIQNKGYRGLFAGLSINYLKVVPSTAIGFTVYDAMKSYLGLPQNL